MYRSLLELHKILLIIEVCAFLHHKSLWTALVHRYVAHGALVRNIKLLVDVFALAPVRRIAKLQLSPISKESVHV